MARRLVLAALATSVAALLAAPGAPAEVAQSGDLRVGLDAQLEPRDLPRDGRAPISVTLDGKIQPLEGGLPPRLHQLKIEINRHGRLDPGAVPVCSIRKIQPSTSADARRVCRSAIVGEGQFRAKVLLPEQTPFPSTGKVIAFNGSYRGKPAVLAHIYGTQPAPTSFTLPFLLSKSGGRFGATMTATMPRVSTSSAYVTGLKMTLGGRAGSARRPYMSAGCPAPAGFGSVVFPLVRAGFAFDGGPTLRSTLMRGCEVRR